jgi:hypothetical protein
VASTTKPALAMRIRVNMQIVEVAATKLIISINKA